MATAESTLPVVLTPETTSRSLEAASESVSAPVAEPEAIAVSAAVSEVPAPEPAADPAAGATAAATVDAPVESSAASPTYPPDPSDGLTREWTNEERKARWPKLDFSKGDLAQKPEFDNLYGPHNALRADLNKLVEALAALNVNDELQVKNLVWWYGTFELLTHNHHEIEETVFIPYFVEIGAGHLLSRERVTADHKELVVTLDALRADMQALAAAPKAGRDALRQALLARVQGFKDAFFAHLREEEDTMCVVSAQHLTPKLEKDLTKRIVNRIKLSDVPLELSWVLHALSPLHRASMAGTLPPPFRFHLPKWDRYFAWRQAHILSIIKPEQHSPPQLAVPLHGFCCC